MPVRLLLDPWQPELGPEIPAVATGGSEEEPTAVDCDVERPAAEWAPIAPSAGETPARIFFVDGVRRVEARVVGLREGKRFLGVFGAYAVGAVAVETTDRKVGYHTLRCERVLVTGAGEALADPVRVSDVLVYAPLSTPDDAPEGPLGALQAQMRLAEETLARALRSEGLVVCDGPLRSSLHGPEPVLGLVKRIANLYVPAGLLPVLGRLAGGERSPILALRGPDYGRYTWFLRLAPPRRGDSEVSGLVRVEAPDAVGLDVAKRLADTTCRVLPAFASVRGLHARAPQNLLPIGALEARLRRELGDVAAIHRQIQTHIAREDT